MSETVFILGAGASKQAGAPLMGNFLDVAEGLLKRNETGDVAEDFELVFRAIVELDRVYAKSNVALQNFEAAFAAFEMANLLGRLGNLTDSETKRLPLAMQQLILQTLEQTVQMPVADGRVAPPAPYGSFLNVTRSPSSQGNARNVAVITFNYDLCFDYACHYNRVSLDYGLDGSAGTALRFLKLHGSLNWASCPKCKQIVPWKLHDYFGRYGWNLWRDDTYAFLRVASHLRELQHCDGPTEGPIIVPPTWSKREHHAQLEVVWRAAAEELSTAENIIVCGYSLPETDQFFRYLYALGTVGNARLKRFWVFDPDEKVEKRFRDLLGASVQDRFQFFPETFEKAVSTLSVRLAS